MSQAVFCNLNKIHPQKLRGKQTIDGCFDDYPFPRRYFAFFNVDSEWISVVYL